MTFDGAIEKMRSELRAAAASGSPMDADYHLSCAHVHATAAVAYAIAEALAPAAVVAAVNAVVEPENLRAVLAALDAAETDGE